jgi:hypothetical protein
MLSIQRDYFFKSSSGQQALEQKNKTMFLNYRGTNLGRNKDEKYR